MILGRRKGKAILVFPPLAYSFAIMFSLTILVQWGKVSPWNWALSLGAWILAVMRTRVVRRTGEWIDVVSLGGRKRLAANQYLVHLETSVTGHFGRNAASTVDNLTPIGPERPAARGDVARVRRLHSADAC
jgi:hypothetical protein